MQHAIVYKAVSNQNSGRICYQLNFCSSNHSAPPFALCVVSHTARISLWSPRCYLSRIMAQTVGYLTVNSSKSSFSFCRIFLENVLRKENNYIIISIYENWPVSSVCKKSHTIKEISVPKLYFSYFFETHGMAWLNVLMGLFVLWSIKHTKFWAWGISLTFLLSLSEIDGLHCQWADVITPHVCDMQNMLSICEMFFDTFWILLIQQKYIHLNAKVKIIINNRSIIVSFIVDQCAFLHKFLFHSWKTHRVERNLHNP